MHPWKVYVLFAFFLSSLMIAPNAAQAIDLGTQINLMDTQILVDHSRGILMGSQAEVLRQRLSGVTATAVSWRHALPNSPQLQSHLLIKLYAISDDLASQRRKSSRTIDSFPSQVARIEYLIDEARACRQITAVEKAALLDELQRLKERHLLLVAAGKLNQKQADVLTKQMVSLNDRVTDCMFFGTRVEQQVAASRISPSR